ncbi:MAG: hypothetical protein K6G80_05345 [Treponema sp.]|nr:hypothetical protein [Treponema sp.]
MNRAFYVLLSAFIFLSSLTACTTSVSSMTDDFNSTFKQTAAPHFGPNGAESENKFETSIFDENFSPSQMLRPSYTLQYNTTLCLKAPAGDDDIRYEWAVTAKAGNAYKKGSETPCVLGTEQQLSLYIPKTDLSILTGYMLTLTLYAGDGSIYTDTATLWIVPELQ